MSKVRKPNKVRKIDLEVRFKKDLYYLVRDYEGDTGLKTRKFSFEWLDDPESIHGETEQVKIEYRDATTYRKK